MPEPIELPEKRAVLFPELVGRGPLAAPSVLGADWPQAAMPPSTPFAMMPPPALVATLAPPALADDDDDDDDRSVASSSSVALGIKSAATSFSASGDDLRGPTTPFEPFDDHAQSLGGDSTAAYDRGDSDGDRDDSFDDDDDDWAGPGDSDDEDDASPRAPARRCRGGPATGADRDGSGARLHTSRFWGVHWDKKNRQWQASYTKTNGRTRTIGRYEDEEDAAFAYNAAVRALPPDGRRRHTNAVDASGALVPKPPGANNRRDPSAVEPPDQARAPTETTSKFWGVTWNKSNRGWQTAYRDANKKPHTIGKFDTQEEAAHAVNAAVRRAGLGGCRHTNPVVNGRLVPKPPRKRKRAATAAAAAPVHVLLVNSP